MHSKASHVSDLLLFVEQYRLPQFLSWHNGMALLTWRVKTPTRRVALIVLDAVEYSSISSRCCRIFMQKLGGVWSVTTQTKASQRIFDSDIFKMFKAFFLKPEPGVVQYDSRT
jgi:uncharacterized protein (DUF486 family)